jgi:hypothetical protein
MTVADWIRARSPAPPPAFTALVIASLGSRADDDAVRVTECCLDAAIALLDQLLAGDPLDRSEASALLAADALVTYAFEAAADAPDRLGDRAADAMVRLAALAGDDREAAHER